MNKVAKYGLGQEVVRLRSMGYGYPSIASQLNVLHGVKFSHMAIKRFLDSTDKIASEVLSEKEEHKERLTKSRLDIIENLASTIADIDEAIEHHREDWRAHSAYLDLKIKNTSIIFKLTKNIQPKENPKIDPFAYQRMFHTIMSKVFDKAELKDGHLIVNNPEVISHYKSTNKIWDTEGM